MSPNRQFDIVALRAVDNMEAALAAAAPRASRELLLLTGSNPTLPPEFTPAESFAMPNSQTTILQRAIRIG
jgi:16S rRNA (guanine527-N7)-methyltransferase